MQIGQKIDEIRACACLAFITGVNNKAGGGAGVCTSAHRLQWKYLKTRTHVFSLQNSLKLEFYDFLCL